MIFVQLLNVKMKIHIFENYMVTYTGKKMDENQGDFRVEQKKPAKFVDIWVKAHQKLSLNWIQCMEVTFARWVSYFKEG